MDSGFWAGRFLSGPRRQGCIKIITRAHPETPDGTLAVSNSKRRHFSYWQGNQGVARRRTWYRLAERRDWRSSPPKPLRPPPKAVAKSAGGPTAPGRKRTLSGRKLTIDSCSQNRLFLRLRSPFLASKSLLSREKPSGPYQPQHSLPGS